MRLIFFMKVILFLSPLFTVMRIVRQIQKMTIIKKKKKDLVKKRVDKETKSDLSLIFLNCVEGLGC